MENIQTLISLNGKAWYRALKVLYFIYVIFCYFIAIAGIIGAIIASFIEEADFSGWWLLLIIPISFPLAWIISEIPKRIFYYIYLGKIYPEK